MALLGNTPWTEMDDTRVAVDAPVSTDLMTDLSINENYLKSAISDGASATQAISTSTVTTSGLASIGTTLTAGGKLTVSAGGADITGDVDLQDNVHIFGNLIVDGTFQFDTAEYLLAGFQSGR